MEQLHIKVVDKYREMVGTFHPELVDEWPIITGYNLKIGKYHSWTFLVFEHTGNPFVLIVPFEYIPRGVLEIEDISANLPIVRKVISKNFRLSIKDAVVILNSRRSNIDQELEVIMKQHESLLSRTALKGSCTAKIVERGKERSVGVYEIGNEKLSVIGSSNFENEIFYTGAQRDTKESMNPMEASKNTPFKDTLVIESASLKITFEHKEQVKANQEISGTERSDVKGWPIFKDFPRGIADVETEIEDCIPEIIPASMDNILEWIETVEESKQLKARESEEVYEAEEAKLPFVKCETSSIENSSFREAIYIEEETSPLEELFLSKEIGQAAVVEEVSSLSDENLVKEETTYEKMTYPIVLNSREEYSGYVLPGKKAEKVEEPKTDFQEFVSKQSSLDTGQIQRIETIVGEEQTEVLKVEQKTFLMELVKENIKPVQKNIDQDLPDKKKVFVIHGENEKIKNSVFDFLSSIGLYPIEFEDLFKSNGNDNLKVSEMLNTVFKTAHAVLSVLTPTEAAMKKHQTKYYYGNRRGEESPPLRSNVLLGTGMALALNRERTIVVEIGGLSFYKDLTGFQTISLDNSSASRKELLEKLILTGCEINISSEEWISKGDFSDIAQLKKDKNGRSSSKKFRILKPRQLSSQSDLQIQYAKKIRPDASKKLSSDKESSYTLNIETGELVNEQTEAVLYPENAKKKEETINKVSLNLTPPVQNKIEERLNEEGRHLHKIQELQKQLNILKSSILNRKKIAALEKQLELENHRYKMLQQLWSIEDLG